jgi:hypothetical protein
MTPHTTPELPESIEKALKPLYVSGSMDVFNLRVAIEKELHTLETKHRAEVEEIDLLLAMIQSTTEDTTHKEMVYMISNVRKELKKVLTTTTSERKT